MGTTMLRSRRMALVMTGVAGMMLVGMAGAAYARPRVCDQLFRNINYDYQQINYWNAVASSARQDSEWDVYSYALGWAHDFALLAQGDTARAAQTGCF